MKQNFLKTFLVCLLTFAGVNASAYDCEIEGLYYNLNTTSQTASVAGGLNYNTVVVIPNEIEYNGVTYPVTSIDDNAFATSLHLKEVTIPNSIKSIGKEAFARCILLTEVTIPNSVVTIGSAAFRYSGLTKVTLSNSLTTIDEATFQFCSMLAEVDIPYSVESIGKDAFNMCNSLTKVTIPNNVTEIGSGAFYDCTGLTELTIGSGVTKIDGLVFSGCTSLEKIVVNEYNPYYDSRENSNAIILTEKNELYFGCKNTTIPNSITSIGNQAFSGCSGLTKLTIPNSVTSIGRQVFYQCSNLTELTIPSSVRNIGDEICMYCSSLEKIVVEDGNPSYDSRENCNAIIRKYGMELIAGCNKTTIPDGVKSIGQSAFRGCSNLENVTIPNSVISIGSSAFENCSSLTNLTIPSSVTSIGNWAFRSCSGLEKIVVEEDNPNYDSRGNCNAIIKTKDNELLFGCKSSTIPSGITSIGNYAFQDCSDLTEVVIPSSVTSIGSSAFYNCLAIISIISQNTTPPTISSITFGYDTRKNATLYVPAGCKSVYEQAQYWSDFSNIQEGNPTGIKPIAANQPKQLNAIYTLNGVKLSTTNISDLSSGIYVVDGKKVVVK